MENQIYDQISSRTGGDIYIGVVGPVRKIQFSKATNNAGTIMTRVNNGTWYAKALPFTYDASTTSLLQIILIGGNSGDLSMKIL